MRVFSCKFYCPFICPSKSSLRVCSPCALKSEDTQHASSSPCPITHGLEETLPDEKMGVEKIDGSAHVKVEKIDGSAHGKVETLLKSSLKKSAGSGLKEVGKREVKWMDMVGKELVEIKEFEPIEPGEFNDDDHGNPACICVIQ